MIKIKLDDVVLSVPESWEDVKLENYEKCFSMGTETRLEQVHYLSRLCGIDAGVVLDNDIRLFQIMVEATSFLSENDFEPVNRIKLKGEDYFVTPYEKLTAAEYIDADTVLGSEGDSRLSELLAIVCRPYGEKYKYEVCKERIPLFQNLSCAEALPLLSFFLFRRKKSEEILSHYSMVREQANQLLEVTENLALNGGGINSLPIWQRIKCIYLILSSKNELRKF